MSIGKIKFEFDKQNFQDFVDKIGDLSQISDIVKLKFNKKYILAYALVASETTVLCLKNYLLDTNKYFNQFTDDKDYDFVISSAPKFVKNIKFFLELSIVKAQISYKPSYEDDSIMHVREMTISTPASKGDRLKITTIGSELSRIRDLKKEVLQNKMNPEMSKWSFKLSTEDLVSLKKMSNINSEEKNISIIIENELVYFAEEGKWNLQVSECKFKDTKITFNKKYLSHILTNQDAIDFKIFETFILVSDSYSNLLLSFETDFTTED
jgi:hypothetical protein